MPPRANTNPEINATIAPTAQAEQAEGREKIEK